MRTFATDLPYRPIDHLVEMIDEPHQTVCRAILEDHRVIFETARGSTYNHQTWEGGYIDHVTDCMNYACHLYAFLASFGRPLPFSRSDALLILFLHDLEKPWRIIRQIDGTITNRPGLETKASFKLFRDNLLKAYGLVLTEAQANAFTYVEGEGNDYSSKRRIMNELAAFCHMVDVWSARGAYDYPKPNGTDEWTGADRFRTTE